LAWEATKEDSTSWQVRAWNFSQIANGASIADVETIGLDALLVVIDGLKNIERQGLI
jgi:hypothetical protein